MSIYIRGMEMPKDGCKSCVFDIFGLCLIRANMDKPYEVTHSCPLIELPPHGRLIDADELERKGADIYQDIVHCGYVEDTIGGFSREMIESANTIIPASGGDEE